MKLHFSKEWLKDRIESDPDLPCEVGGPFENTDREIYRVRPGDYYSDSIHVTEQGHIGMNVCGRVIVMPLRHWFQLAHESLKEGIDNA